MVVSEGNEVIVPASGETAEDIARASAVVKSGIIIGGDLNILRPFESIDPLFLALTISNGEPKKQLAGKAKGISIVHIHNSDIQEIVVSFPTKDEQSKIVAVFQGLDHLITLHQRKLEKAKSLKKSLLSEMFPAEGERKPKRRFPGFTGDWEQRKAEDVADYSKGSGYSKKDLRDKGTPIILYGRLYTNYQFFISDVDTFSEKKSGVVVSEGNEVIVPASGETAEDIARASAVVKSGIIIGGDLNILRPFESIDPLFLALTISNGEPKKQLAGKAKGISIVHIHNSDIQEIVVSFPTKDEQSKIVAVFQGLDHLITLHQRKLEKLRNLKKAYLNEMFL